MTSIAKVCRFLFFFFFQAEDGIRDYKVTGVQTCALPISRLHLRSLSGCLRSRIGGTASGRPRGGTLEPGRLTGGPSPCRPLSGVAWGVARTVRAVRGAAFGDGRPRGLADPR